MTYDVVANAIKQARAYAAAHPEQSADVGVTIILTIAQALRQNDAQFDMRRFIAEAGLQV